MEGDLFDEKAKVKHVFIDGRPVNIERPRRPSSTPDDSVRGGVARAFPSGRPFLRRARLPNPRHLDFGQVVRHVHERQRPARRARGRAYGMIRGEAGRRRTSGSSRRRRSGADRSARAGPRAAARLERSVTPRSISDSISSMARMRSSPGRLAPERGRPGSARRRTWVRADVHVGEKRDILRY